MVKNIFVESSLESEVISAKNIKIGGKKHYKWKGLVCTMQLLS